MTLSLHISYTHPRTGVGNLFSIRATLFCQYPEKSQASTNYSFY